MDGQTQVNLLSAYLLNNENYNNVSQPCVSIDYRGWGSLGWILWF